MIAFHKDGTLPTGDEIFVFGSNLAGRHGAGAAMAARTHYGAVPGWGAGFMGQCYAIPTKAWNLTDVLPLERIAGYIVKFVDFADKHPDMRFFVTRVGCGLAGYSDAEIAPLFDPVNWTWPGFRSCVYGAPENCSFAEEWRPFLT